MSKLKLKSWLLPHVTLAAVLVAGPAFAQEVAGQASDEPAAGEAVHKGALRMRSHSSEKSSPFSASLMNASGTQTIGCASQRHRRGLERAGRDRSGRTDEAGRAAATRLSGRTRRGDGAGWESEPGPP